MIKRKTLLVHILFAICITVISSVSYANDNYSSDCAIPLNTKTGTNISTAIKSVKTKACTIVVDSPQVARDLVIPKNIFLKFTKGGSFIIEKGSTVAIQGHLEAPMQQIYYGEGAIIIDNNGKEAHPEWWGAKGDGASDNTMPIQKSIDALAKTGGTVKLAPGNYFSKELILYSNIRMTGSSEGESILTHFAAKRPGKVESLIGISKLSRGASNSTDNARHIEISRIAFIGRVLAQGFSEHHHLVYLDGVSDVFIHDCKFVGFQGDGIYIGQRGKKEQHNERIKVMDCLFDGINNENRNGISITDGTDIVIENNSFINSTRKNMPGNIDIEPNFVYDRIQNITIKGNKFTRYYGNKGAIGVYFSRPLSSYLTPPNNFLIEKNFIDNDYYNAGAGAQNAIIFYSYNQAVTDSTHDMHIRIIDNKIHNDVRLIGVKGIEFAGNTVSALNRYCMLGDITNSKGLQNISDAIIKNNVFNNTGNANGALSIGNASNIKIYNNTFSRIKLNGIVFAGYKAITASDNIEIFNNSFIGPMSNHVVKQLTHISNNAFIHNNSSKEHKVAPNITTKGI